MLKEQKAEGMSREESLNRLVPWWHDVLIRTPVETVEVDTAQVIRQLQKKGIPTVALTARYIEMAYPTLEQLKSVSIDFSKGAIAKNDFTIHAPYPAKFIGGVIFGGLNNLKSLVLLQFFEQNPVSFDRIIFVDDKKKNVEDIRNVAIKLNKEYVGIWYRAMEKKQHSLDPDIGKLQTIFYGKIIPDHLIQLIDKDKF